MNVLKYAIISYLTAITLNANAQNKVRPFNPDGTPYPVDTSKVKSLKQYVDFSGYKI